MGSEELSRLGDMLPALAYFFVTLAIVGLVATTLADKGNQKQVLLLCLIGFFVAFFKIWLVQLTPQWHDVPSDSLTYQLHAQALASHWQGNPVDASAHRLNGFLTSYSDLGSFWTTEMAISYAGVLGSHEWIYTAYLASWRLVSENWLTWAMYSNAAFAAIFPAASYGIARQLDASGRVAVCAAIIALCDPSSSVNASWLLKDTLAGFVTVTAAWAAMCLIRKQSMSAAIIMILAVAVLGHVRFVAFIALLISAPFVFPTMFGISYRRSAGYFGSAIIGATFLFGFLYTFPSSPKIVNIVHAIAAPLQGQQQTFAKTNLDSSADNAVVEWKQQWKTDPIKAFFKATARTLLAPYPWLVVTPGLNFSDHYELYLLGMPVWIFCLPGLFWGLIICSRTPNRQYLFLAVMLICVWGAYTLFFGGWSTRQRIFMLPILFSFAAIGWCDLYDRRKLAFKG